jgi:hypothetical protein
MQLENEGDQIRSAEKTRCGGDVVPAKGMGSRRLPCEASGTMKDATDLMSRKLTESMLSGDFAPFDGVGCSDVLQHSIVPFDAVAHLGLERLQQAICAIAVFD